MGQYIINLSDEEEKALLTDMISIQAWIDNAIHNKARQCIDKVVLEVSDKNPVKTKEKEKLKIVRDAKIKSAAERNAEIDEHEGLQ